MNTYLEPFLYHGIRGNDIERLINIFNTGYILPKKMLEGDFKVEANWTVDTTGKSWIALSQKVLIDREMLSYLGEDSNNKSVAYDNFIENHLCIVIDKDYNSNNLSYPQWLRHSVYGPEEIEAKIKDDSDDRYSPCIDEVQTRKPISIKHFIAIGYPKTYLESKGIDTEKELKLIRDVLIEHNAFIPVCDSSNYDFADNYECIKKYDLKLIK